MIQHTILFSFDQPLPDGELDTFLREIGELMLGPGDARSFQAKPNVPTPGDENTPVLMASAIATMTFADVPALAAASALPSLGEFIGRWQRTQSYQVFAINHDPLA